MIALQDRNRRNVPPYAYGIVKIFILCSLINRDFIPNLETTEIEDHKGTDTDVL